MSQLISNQLFGAETEKANWKSMYAIAGLAGLLQLALPLAIVIVSFFVELNPGASNEFFTILYADRIAVSLRDDFASLIVVALYLGTFPGLYVALMRINPTYSALATLFAFIGVTVVFTTHSGFSLLYLSDQYAAATTEAQRAQLLAAGQAVIASDMWNSSGGYMSGILLQGAGVIISLVMLRSKDFSKVTAYAGLLGNALDLTQHILHPFTPSISEVLLRGAGPFYVVWFVMLGRDFFRLRRDGLIKENKPVETERLAAADLG
jgi:ribose/xylose/arabinose/galactoside ABC-type transport system permease subunit